MYEDSRPDRQNKPNVLVIYTGGTMGMLADKDTGALAPVPGYLSQQILKLSDGTDVIPAFTVKEYDDLIDSSEVHTWRRPPSTGVTVVPFSD